jgi:hypothetical protein
MEEMMADPNTAGQAVEKDEFDEWFAEDEDHTYAYSDEDAEEETVDDEEPEAESSTAEDDGDVPDEEDPDTSAEATGEGSSDEQRNEEDDPYAWIDQLDPEFRRKAESLVNGYKSNSGRAAAEARRNAELQARLDMYAAEQQAQQRTAGKAAGKPAETSASLEEMDDDELKEFMEEYPNVARSVQKLIDRRTEESLRPIQQEREAARVYENKQRLRQEAAQLFNTAETGVSLDDVLNSRKWKEWYMSQPEGYRTWIGSTQTVEDSMKVLSDFADFAEKDMQRMYAQQQEAQQSQEASSADETAARRREARQGTSPKSRSADTGKGTRGMSYEDIFNDYVEADG